MNVLVKFPTRSRPETFFDTFLKWRADPLPRFLITIDDDDETMNTVAIRKRLQADRRVTLRVGHSKSKIEAVNDGVKEANWELLILAADDFIPQRKDYAHRIVELFKQNFPDGDGVLHLNDGNNGPTLNTLPILDRKYFDRFGYVYHHDYTSLWADNEFQEVSERLGRAVYVDEVLLRHEWVGNTPDQLHYHNESFFDADQKIYEARKALGFPA